MYEQTSAGRDREMDVGGGTVYESAAATGADPMTGTQPVTGTGEGGTSQTGTSEGVKDKAATAAKTGAQAASGSARDVAQTAKDEARNVAGEVSTQARRVAGDVREQLTNRANEQHGTLVNRLRQASGEMHEMAGGREQSPASTLVSNLAERTNRFADHLESRGPEGVLNDVQDFARRRPGTFLLAAAAAGFVVGRLGKSVFTAPNNPLSGDGDRGYQSAYEAGSADTAAGFREGYSGTGFATTEYATPVEPVGTTAPTGATTYATTTAQDTELIRDEGGWEDPRPDTVLDERPSTSASDPAPARSKGSRS